MTSGAGGPDADSPHDLGSLLAPALLDACAGRLSDLHWFRADWQQGGAATAFATAHGFDGGPRPVVVKFPIGWREYRALVQLQDACPVLPRIVFHGTELGGSDIAWVVMERLPGHTLGDGVCKESITDLMAAAAHFYTAARRWPISAPPEQADWDRLLGRARDAVRDNSLEHEQRWLNAIKRIHKGLPAILREWDARPCSTWCHGDLHPGNAMRRPAASPWGPPGVVLLDFAEVHTGHWVEDAVYLERLFWARPDEFKGIKPVSLLAKAVRDSGVDIPEDVQRLASIRRALISACVPAYLHREGHPRYLHAALDVLERSADQVAR